MPIKAIARRLGVGRNTVRRALAADEAPKYQRPARGSVVDAAEPKLRELLAGWPQMPATVIAERIGWDRSLTVLKDRVRELRPLRAAGSDPTARLSVRAVAARAGVSTGSLRHFFPTQRALIDTVVAGVHTVDLPDDPMQDPARTPAERLVACLQLLLAQVGTGGSAREHWRTLHAAYVASPPSDDSVHAFLALERLTVHRVETWLAHLRDEGALAPGELEHRARFLVTVVDGLLAERALPGDVARLEFEAGTLVTAARAVLQPASSRQTNSAIS